MDLNKSAKKSKTGQFLKNYGPMYGIVNYGGESWHWEMNAENRAFFEKETRHYTNSICIERSSNKRS
jgi:hypothetical protein